MKTKLIAGIFLACLSASAFSEPLQDDSTPITLKLNDNSVVNVTTCEDFIALRRAGKTVTDFENMPDRFASMAQNSLTDCYLTTWAKAQGLTEVNPPPATLTISDVVKHFPATAAVAISDDEVARVKTHYQNKTIIQKEPDLKADDMGRLISAKSSDGYIITGHRAFKGQDGKLTDFITLGKFVTGGTWSVSTTYRIVSQNEPVWKIQEVTENDPL